MEFHRRASADFRFSRIQNSILHKLRLALIRTREPYSSSFPTPWMVEKSSAGFLVIKSWKTHHYIICPIITYKKVLLHLRRASQIAMGNVL